MNSPDPLAKQRLETWKDQCRQVNYIAFDRWGSQIGCHAHLPATLRLRQEPQRTDFLQVISDPEGRALGASALSKLLAGATSVSYFKRLYPRDSYPIFVQVTTHAIRNVDGSLAYAFVIIQPLRPLSFVVNPAACQPSSSEDDFALRLSEYALGYASAVHTEAVPSVHAVGVALTPEMCERVEEFAERHGLTFDEALTAIALAGDVVSQQ